MSKQDTLQAVIAEMRHADCDSDLKACRENWPDDLKSWCTGCLLLFSAQLISDLQADRERLQQAVLTQIEIAEQRGDTLTRLRVLVEKWTAELAEYPRTDLGFCGAAAARLCASELIAELDKV